MWWLAAQRPTSCHTISCPVRYQCVSVAVGCVNGTLADLSHASPLLRELAARDGALGSLTSGFLTCLGLVEDIARTNCMRLLVVAHAPDSDSKQLLQSAPHEREEVSLLEKLLNANHLCEYVCRCLDKPEKENHLGLTSVKTRLGGVRALHSVIKFLLEVPQIELSSAASLQHFHAELTKTCRIVGMERVEELLHAKGCDAVAEQITNLKDAPAVASRLLKAKESARAGIEEHVHGIDGFAAVFAQDFQLTETTRQSFANLGHEFRAAVPVKDALTYARQSGDEVLVPQTLLPGLT